MNSLNCFRDGGPVVARPWIINVVSVFLVSLGIVQIVIAKMSRDVITDIGNAGCYWAGIPLVVIGTFSVFFTKKRRHMVVLTFFVFMAMGVSIAGAAIDGGWYINGVGSYSFCGTGKENYRQGTHCGQYWYRGYSYDNCFCDGTDDRICYHHTVYPGYTCADIFKVLRPLSKASMAITITSSILLFFYFIYLCVLGCCVSYPHNYPLDSAENENQNTPDVELNNLPMQTTRHNYAPVPRYNSTPGPSLRGYVDSVPYEGRVIDRPVVVGRVISVHNGDVLSGNVDSSDIAVAYVDPSAPPDIN